ncbi:MAG: hypothetical protein MK297_03540 [Planctomycetes bacterium]|nr:hypothetical protein [Planctomycetota bacterium]
MKRPMIIAPVALAIAVGGWYLLTPSEGAAPAPVAPQPSQGSQEQDMTPLPLLEQARQSGASAFEERSQGVLTKPLLSLLARKATDGEELAGVQVTLRPLEAEGDEGAITVKTDADVGASAELDAGDWLVIFESEGYVPEARQVELDLGDEELLEVSLVRGARVTGSAADRFGQPLAGQKLFFLAPGQAHPRLPRDAEGILSTTIDRKGEIVPITVPPELYTITYGNLGAPKLKTEGRLNAGEDAELFIVYGGKSRVRFELDASQEEGRRLEVQLEELDEQRTQRERERRLKNPERAARDQAKGKRLEQWRKGGKATLRDGVGEIRRARPGVYRVTLLTRPGEYSSEPLLTLEADQSVLVKIQAPALPARSGSRKGDPKVPKEGPLNVTIIRDSEDPNMRDEGLYWR